jgi:succinate dehydrogenase/fumarate reductase flavoprotein subunit
MCREAPKAVLELESYGMPFSRTEEVRTIKNLDNMHYKYN